MRFHRTYQFIFYTLRFILFLLSLCPRFVNNIYCILGNICSRRKPTFGPGLKPVPKFCKELHPVQEPIPPAGQIQQQVSTVYTVRPLINFFVREFNQLRLITFSPSLLMTAWDTLSLVLSARIVNCTVFYPRRYTCTFLYVQQRPGRSPFSNHAKCANLPTYISVLHIKSVKFLLKLRKLINKNWVKIWRLQVESEQFENG